MLVTTKLRIHLIIAIIALILKIVIFSSPGWAVFRFPLDEYIEEPYPSRFSDDDPLPEGDTPRPPIAMAKRDTNGPKEEPNIMKKMYMPQKEEYEMNIRLGLWYFVTCIHRCHRDKHEDYPKDMVLDDKDEKNMVQHDKDSSEAKHADVHHKNHKKHRHHHCAVSTYEKAEKNAHELPKEMAPARLVYKNVGSKFIQIS